MATVITTVQTVVFNLNRNSVQEITVTQRLSDRCNINVYDYCFIFSVFRFFNVAVVYYFV